MSWYGKTNNTYLTRDIIKCILNHLPQYQSVKLELNHKLIALIRQSRRPIIELCRRCDLESVDACIVNAISRTYRDVAIICYYLLDSQIMGQHLREYYWYSDHRWSLKNDRTLELWMRNALTDLYEAVFDGINITYTNMHLVRGIKKLLLALGRNSFVSAVRGELLELCFREVIVMDENKKLWGCHNGVIVAENDIIYFRDGLPTDYITLSTNLDYDDNLTFGSASVERMEHILRQIFPIGKLYDYVMKLFSSLLSDDTHHFILLDNSVCSGRSTIVELIKLAFGDYCSEEETARILLVDDYNSPIGLRKLCHIVQKEYSKPRLNRIQDQAKFEVIPFLSRFGRQPNSLPADVHLKTN